MWKLISEVDAVLSLPNKSLLTALRIMGQQPRFDVAILFPNSLRCCVPIWTTFFVASATLISCRPSLTVRDIGFSQ